MPLKPQLCSESKWPRQHILVCPNKLYKYMQQLRIQFLYVAI